MIKITRFFYVHLTIIPLMVIAVATKSLAAFGITYSVVLLHELFHLFAALFLRVPVKSVILMPFGMTLRLSAGVIKKPYKEILVALAGPFANCLMIAVFLLFMPIDNLNGQLFLIANAAILCLNLIPVPPLDGGRVLRAVLVKKAGLWATVKFMRHLSYCILCLLGIAAVALLVFTRGNMSLVMICAFLLYNMTDEKRYSELLHMRTLLYDKEKLQKNALIPTKQLLVHKDTSVKTILRKWNFSTFYTVSVVDDSLSLLGTVTESDIIRTVVHMGYGITAGQVLHGLEEQHISQCQK